MKVPCKDAVGSPGGGRLWCRNYSGPRAANPDKGDQGPSSVSLFPFPVCRWWVARVKGTWTFVDRDKKRLRCNEPCLLPQPVSLQRRPVK